MGCTVGNMIVNHLMFADDTRVAPALVDFIVFWIFVMMMIAEHEIAFNCNKTIGVSFCPQRYNQPAPSNIFPNGVNVQFSDQVKYLCILLNASLKDDNDIQRQVKSLYCAANKLRSTFAQCSTAVKNTTACLLHANVCLPIVQQNTQHTDKYEAPTRCVLCRIMHCTNGNASVHPHQVDQYVKTSDALFRIYLYGFVRRCAFSCNFVIRSLEMFDDFYKSSFFLHYFTL